MTPDTYRRATIPLDGGREKHDLTRQRFGRWRVVREDQSRPHSPQVFWMCICDCGEQRSVVQGNLLDGTSTQCAVCSRVARRKVEK